MSAQLITENGDESKADRTPFLKLYTDDWLAGTMELSDEEQGFYIRLLCLMWNRKAGLPAGVDEIALLMRRDRRKVRRLVDRLIDLGKLQIIGDEVVNSRMQREIQTWHRQVSAAKSRGEVGPKSGRSPSEVGPKSGRSRAEVGPKSERISGSSTAKSKACASTQTAPMEDHPEARSQTPEPDSEVKGLTNEEDGSCLEGYFPAGIADAEPRVLRVVTGGRYVQ